MTPFLNCNIWIVPNAEHTDDHFYPVFEVCEYNSNNDNFSMYVYGTIIIPEFEIENLELLQNLNFDAINKNNIYILKRDNIKWSINLKYYDTYIRSKNT
jgi:hypothetical protein